MEYPQILIVKAVKVKSEGLAAGIDTSPSVDALLKEYTVHQYHHNSAVRTFKNMVLGIYYLTLARWTAPEKYALACKAMGWLA